jgi:glycosyltransferase involved in cell wall biosynthesis
MNFLIVTPNYNSGRFIQETFQRMLDVQKSSTGKHNVTWIIMDSCSTDESISILRVAVSKYGYHNLRDNWGIDIRLEVKKDSGMYEGINNGLRMAKEISVEFDCFFWLNADDLVSSNSFDSIEASMTRVQNKLSMIVGRGIDIDENSKTILDQPHPVIDTGKLRRGDFNYTSGDWLKAESCIFPRKLVEIVGYFNESLRLAGDYDYIVRCAKVADPFFDESCYAREFRRCAGQQSEDLRPYEIERKKIAKENNDIQLENASVPDPIECIFFYPDYSSGNSYQTSLYANYKNKGFSTFEDLQRSCPQLKAGDVFHIHWLNDIIRREESIAAAFFDWLKKFILRSKQEGAKILWTIHNIHSHEDRNRHIEQEIYKFLSDACDRCHMHEPFVVYEFLEYYNYLPWGKIRIAEHGSYQFVEGPQSSLVNLAFGLSKNDRYVAVPGQLRRYKNIPMLVQASKYLQKNYSNLQICMLGQPHPELTQAEVSTLYDQPNVLFSRSRLSDDDYSRLVRDALFALLTYQSISTSGSAIHALSQGTLVVAPCMGCLQTHITSSRLGFLYQNDMPGSLFQALDKAIEAQSNLSAIKKTCGNWNARWSTMIPLIMS